MQLLINNILRVLIIAVNIQNEMKDLLIYYRLLAPTQQVLKVIFNQDIPVISSHPITRIYHLIKFL